MKRWHKFVLVLSVLFVLITSFVVTSFADSASYGDDDLKPIFAPTSFMAYDSSESVVFDLPLIIRTDDSQDNIDYVVYGTKILNNYEDVNEGTLYYTIDYPSTSIYGTSFVPYYNFQLARGYNRFRITFNDFYYASYDVDDDDAGDYLNRFFEFDPNFSNLGLPVFYTVRANITSLDQNRDLIEDFYTHTSTSVEDVISALDSYVDSNYSQGALLTNIEISNDLNPLQGSDFSRLSFDAHIVCESLNSPSAGEKALNAWEPYFGDIINHAPPTILESVTRGLNAIWDTSLFGSFTIGQAFSACAGLALFGWLLRIFSK